MVRKLKHHEQKLLRKHDFTTYKSDSAHRAATICRRYAISKPGDYESYNRVAGQCKKLAHLLSLLPPDSPFRLQQEKLLLDKLHSIGLLTLTLPTTSSTSTSTPSTSSSSLAGKLSSVKRSLSASTFCRRRIGVVMTRLKMAENVTAANRFVEQGHVRVGTDVVTDPAFLVGREVEDWVTWCEGSKVKRGIQRFRGEIDDFE